MHEPRAWVLLQQGPAPPQMTTTGQPVHATVPTAQQYLECTAACMGSWHPEAPGLPVQATCGDAAVTCRAPHGWPLSCRLKGTCSASVGMVYTTRMSTFANVYIAGQLLCHASMHSQTLQDCQNASHHCLYHSGGSNSFDADDFSGHSLTLPSGFAGLAAGGLCSPAHLCAV